MAVHLDGKVLLDTNVVIDFLREGAHRPWVLGHVGQTIRFLSSIVLLELRLGADTLPRRRAVDRMRDAALPDRVVAPTEEHFERAGSIFRAMFHPGAEPADRLGPINDILIALTAWQIGASLITQNVSDFQRIGKHLSGLRIVNPAQLDSRFHR